MPISRKKLAAKKRLKHQLRNISSGQFVMQYSDSEDEYKYESDNDYSTDSSDENYCTQRILKLGEISFVWTNKETDKKKAPYTGNSTASYYRKYGPSGTYTKAAKDSLPITQYFTTQLLQAESEIIEEKELDKELPDRESPDKESDDESDDESDNEPNEESDEDSEEFENEMDIDNDFSNKMEALEIILHQNKKKISVYDYLSHRSIYEFFINWKEKGMTCKNAAFNAAKKVYDKGLYRARIINKWAKSWIENGVLPVSLQGCHQKIKSFIDDEDVIEKSLEFIRESEGKITPKLYRTFVNNTLFSQMKITASISEKTSRVWLRKLGFVPQSRKKGIYFNGHERPDLMPTFEGNNMKQKDPILPNGKKLHIFVTHDECLFYANDDRPIIWAPLGEPPLRKKGQGKSIMVSDFLLETIGCLKLTDEQAQVYPN
ncbi:hypothetical protein RhiirB3_448578 [Rhizophagus irregularis]|nr:hypothetical protein RhiirB3_448578 [Rhizophagus irregularis]